MRQTFIVSLFLSFCIFFLGVYDGFAIPKSPEELAKISGKLINTNVLHGAIPALNRPTFGRMMDADLSMNDSEIVFIVEFPNGPRIYPQSIMVWHQVANEFIGNSAYAVTYSPITGTLAAYQTTIDKNPFYFDVEGRLFEGNSVLIDRNTGSLWIQALGMAFEGPMLGRGLAKLPVFWTTWGAAKRAYSEAPVLSRPSGNRKAYGRDPYGSYLKPDTYYTNDILAYPVQYIDYRLPHKNPVIGLEIDTARIAIDISYIKQHGAVNFFVGQLPLLAVHDTNLDVVRIFNRQVWDKPSLFVLNNGQLIDIESKTTWDSATGRALMGNMQGASMVQYYGIYSMWFSWYSLNPETFLIPGPGEVPKNMLHLEPLAKPK